MTYECGRKRQEIKLLKEGGANEDDLIAARSRYRGTSAEYACFSKAMDLPQQRERVTVDGLGNIGQGKYTKHLTNAVGHPIIEVKKTTLIAEHNSITQYTTSKGAIDRNYYGTDGKQTKQVSNTDHGHKKESKFGKHGEHAHDYYIDEKGMPKHGPARDLTDEERKENSDIL